MNKIKGMGFVVPGDGSLYGFVCPECAKSIDDMDFVERNAIDDTEMCMICEKEARRFKNAQEQEEAA